MTRSLSLSTVSRARLRSFCTGGALPFALRVVPVCDAPGYADALARAAEAEWAAREAERAKASCAQALRAQAVEADRRAQRFVPGA